MRIRIVLPLLAIMTATAAMADERPAATGPRPGTVEAMQCLVGIRQDSSECIKMFVGSAQRVAPPWVFVGADQRFQRGRLISSTYWGRASASNMYDAKAMLTLPTREMDIFDVKYAHTEYTFYISPADAEGKINALTILLYGPHDPFQVTGCSGGRLCVSGTP